MKNLFLTLAFMLVGTFAFADENSIAEFSSDCCVCDAWDFGTEYGQGDSDLEYILTDAYYEDNCV